MELSSTLGQIRQPQFNRRDYSTPQFIDFLADYYTAEEMIESGEDSRLKELLEPSFQHYRSQNIRNAQESVKEAGKIFMGESDAGLVSASNLFLSYFAQRHLSQHLDPQHLFDSDFAKIHPNGLYVRSGAYILLTKDSRFLISRFTREERELMFNLMDLYQVGFSKDLTRSWDNSRRSRKRF